MRERGGDKKGRGRYRVRERGDEEGRGRYRVEEKGGQIQGGITSVIGS